MPPARKQPIDVIGMFEDLEREAANALKKIAAGEAKNGVAALQRIRARAEDGARWAPTMPIRDRERQVA